MSFQVVYAKVSNNTLQQDEKFMHLGVVFRNDGSQKKEVVTLISKANTV